MFGIKWGYASDDAAHQSWKMKEELMGSKANSLSPESFNEYEIQTHLCAKEFFEYRDYYSGSHCICYKSENENGYLEFQSFAFEADCKAFINQLDKKDFKKVDFEELRQRFLYSN